jgi:hypothetical protein
MHHLRRLRLPIETWLSNITPMLALMQRLISLMLICSDK